MQIKKSISIILLLTAISHISLTLTPSCNSIQPPALIPLVLGETYNLQLDNFFAGSNLDFSLSTSSPTTKLNKKIEQTDSKVFSFPNIIHQYVQQKDSQWGKQTSILYRNGTKTYLTFGIYSTVSILDKSSTVLVSDEEDVVCFNSVLFPEQNISIVDCIKKRSDYIDNYFYYIDTQKLNVIKTVRNSMYYFFSSITKRDMLKIKGSSDGHDYLVRSYFSDGVESKMSSYAYAQIYNAKNPLNLTILKILDKNFFNETSLNITMAKLAKGNIYILNSTTGIFEIKIVNDSQIQLQTITKKDIHVFDFYQTSAAIFANDEYVYEANAGKYGEYQIIGKYSLFGFGNVSNVLMNDKFVVFLAKNKNSSNIEIFRKGTGYYSNSFTFITNLSHNLHIYLHKNSNVLQITSESKITLYQLSQPKVIHKFVNGHQGTIQNVTITAQSKSFNSTQGQKCQVKYQLKVVSSNDQIILKSNNPASKKYYKNKLQSYSTNFVNINLNNYFYGTNISYQIVNKTSSNSSLYFIQKVNQRDFQISTKVQGNIIFMKIYQDKSNDTKSQMFVQTSDYILYRLSCYFSSSRGGQSCDVQQTSTQFKSPIRSLTALNGQIFAVTQQKEKNQIMIHNTKTSPDSGLIFKQDLKKIVTAITLNKEQLYVLKSGDSVIDVYKTNNRDPWKIKSQINVTNLSKSQSNALDILSDRNHPSILFLKYPKSILLIDTSIPAANVLIAEIQIKQTSPFSFSFLVNKNKLIIVSSSNTISIYSIDQLKQGKVTQEKKLPLYGNYLSSTQNTISSKQFLYVPTVNPKNNFTSIFIYKLNNPTAISLYASFDLPKNFSSSNLHMEVYFQSSDKLTIADGLQYLLYEIFYEPKAVFTEDINQKFQLTFSNPYSSITQVSQTCEIEMTPDSLGFNKTKDLDSFAKEVKLDKSSTYSWNDRKWFEGNILDYNYTCAQCDDTPESKLSFRSHNGEEKSLDNYTAFFETPLGSICIKDRTLIKLNRDLTVRQKITLPHTETRIYNQKVVSTNSEDVIVTIQTQIATYYTAINLIFTTKVGNQSKTSQILRTLADFCQKAEIVGDLLMLLDNLPFHQKQKGQIHLYDLKMERIKKYQTVSFIEPIEIINQKFLINVLGYNRNSVFIQGSHLMKLQTNIYRLYVSQSKGGLFIIDFTYKVGQKELNIIKMTFEDLNVVLAQNNFSLPSNVNTNSLDFVSSSVNNNTTIHSLLVTYYNFDNFIFSIEFDLNHKIIKKQLKSLLQRYDNFQTGYQVRVSVSGDFVGIYYYQEQGSSKNNFLAIYDISNFSSTQEIYSKKYIFTSIRANLSIPEFAFNKTSIQASNGKSVGIITWIYYGLVMKEQIIYKNIQLTLKPGYKTDNFTLIPWKFDQTESINLPITVSAASTNNFFLGNLQKQTLFDQ